MNCDLEKNTIRDLNARKKFQHELLTANFLKTINENPPKNKNGKK
jgi:hypothetical protein